MAAVTLALVRFFAFLICGSPRRDDAAVHRPLAEDPGAIVKDLERQGVPYDIKNDGAIVLVPKDR